MIKPSDFLKQAKSLLENNDDEVNLRTAISRAYYSLYHEALNYIITYKKTVLTTIIKNEYFEGKMYDSDKINNLDFGYLKKNNVNLHSVVASSLLKINSFNSYYKDKFIGFREDRNMADYELDETLKEDEIKIKIDNIDQIITSIKNNFKY